MEDTSLPGGLDSVQDLQIETNVSIEEVNKDNDEYVYDYYESLMDIPFGEVIPVSIIYGLTFLFGITGNVLVIWTISRRLHSPTNIFLVSLASADLVLVSVCIPIKLVRWFTFTWGLGVVLCKLVHYVQNLSALCSVLTLTAISMERYYAILYPMRAKFRCTAGRARKVVLALWMISIILATPIIMGQIHKEVGKYRTGYWCLEEWPHPLYEQVYDVTMLIVILIIPIILMSFAYISIGKELWLVSSIRNTLRENGSRAGHVHHDGHCCGRYNHGLISVRHGGMMPDDSAMRKQVVKMLVAVIILFIICWSPLLIDNTLVAFGVLERLNYGALKPLRQAFALLAYGNSCVNPIVYAFMSNSFRQSFKMALCTSCVTERNYSPSHHRILGPNQSLSLFQTKGQSLDSDAQLKGSSPLGLICQRERSNTPTID